MTEVWRLQIENRKEHYLVATMYALTNLVKWKNPVEVYT